MWWKLSGCPRCGGDMFIDRELYYGWYEQCIMCGCTNELKNLQSDGKMEINLASKTRGAKR